MIRETESDPAPLVVGEQTVSIPTEDGFPLAGTLFTGTPAAGGTSATARSDFVRYRSAARLLRRFRPRVGAARLSGGAHLRLRGMPQSPRPKGWNARINMRDWAHLDMPAAMACLDRQAPGHPIVGVGQSFGGQALGICGDPGRFDRYCMVASLSGYYRGNRHAVAKPDHDEHVRPAGNSRPRTHGILDGVG